MGAKLSNNALSSLASSISTSDTSLTLSTGTGELFPSIGVGEWFMATITKVSGGSPLHEIVKVTARVTDTLTIVRAQEDTTALSFLAGDKIDVRATAGILNSKMDKEGGTFTGPVTMSDKELSETVLKDCGMAYTDRAATNTLDYRDGQMQRWAPGSGAQALSITNWPPVGVLGMLMIEGVNLGAASTTTDAPVNYVKSDGTFSTTTSLNANHGATLQTSGIDFIIIWSRDGGATRYAKVVR